MNSELITRHRKHAIALGLCVAMAGTLAVSSQGFSQQAELGYTQLPQFSQLVKQNSDAVVSIRGARKASSAMAQPNMPQMPEGIPEQFKRFFDEDFFNRFKDMPKDFGQAIAQGSGFIISDDGYVLTNAHVVRGADELTVRLSDRSEYSADVIGMDERTDVALLKIDGQDLPTVTLGDSDELEVGDWLLAIGSPFGLDYSASQGIVSALGRSLPDGTYVPFIQTDVAVNPGNSGGPLFDLDGKVIGINAQIYSRSGGYQGVSFAIPINLAMNIVEQLKTHGSVSRGWLGVMIQDVNHDLAASFGLPKPAGALVSQVMPNSPAEKAGLKVGDVILRYDGNDIERSAELPPLVGTTPIDDKIEIEVLRDGQHKTLNTKIAKLDEGQVQQLAQSDAEQSSKLGVAVSELGKDKLKELELEHGVLIGEVQPNSPAAKAGLQQGDIIVSFNRKPVNNAEQLVELVKNAPTDKPSIVLVKRDNGTVFVPVHIG